MDYTYQGRRVALVAMNDPYTNLKPGDMGTLQYQDDIGNIHVQWDNGSTLSLIPGVDEFDILPQEQTPQNQ